MVAISVYQNNSCGDWTLFSFKNFPLFQEIYLATDHVSENDL